MKYLKLVALGFALCAWCEFAQAQVQSRADTIESARTEKEANLKPETPPKAERDIVWAENSLPYRLVTSQADGFGVVLGSIVPGQSFGVGPSYRRTGLWGGKLALAVQARGSANESYLGRFDFSLSHLLGDRAFLNFTTLHRNISEMPYYGAGPDSRKTGRSDYRLEDTNVEVRPGVRIYKGLRATAIGSFLAVNTGPGHSTRYISTEDQFRPGIAPGIDRQTNFWRGGGLVEYDWRDHPSGATSGGRYAAQYIRYLDRQFSSYSFFRLDLDAVQYIPLFNRTRVIALHGASSFTDTQNSQRVPFYLQPILGGPDTLRGFRYGRFYGNNSALVSAEYRWFCSPILELAAFADGGRVFNRWEQWNFHNLQTNVGFSVHVKGRTGRSAFSLDTGFSHEGFQIWFRANNLTL
jgi:outer membrane protein assembly factor BamA